MRRVLLVDDEEYIRRFYAEELSEVQTFHWSFH